jgi:hypothetical protein
MLVKFSTVVPVSRAVAWAFAANFENIGAWDPGVKSSKKVCANNGGGGGGGGNVAHARKGLAVPQTPHTHEAFRAAQLSAGTAGVGSEYELVTVFKGSESTMKCAHLCASRCRGLAVALPWRDLTAPPHLSLSLQVHRGALGRAHQGEMRACAAAVRGQGQPLRRHG